jgi:hypothetical protein
VAQNVSAGTVSFRRQSGAFRKERPALGAHPSMSSGRGEVNEAKRIKGYRPGRSWITVADQRILRTVASCVALAMLVPFVANDQRAIFIS